jgi:Anti-sigma-K factor rskA, C-terminal
VTSPGCPRIDDAASYVLRAMPDGEWEVYQEHLARCTPCAEKVAELRFVADALLSGVPQLSAPAPVRGRVMAIVRAESELLRAAGHGADQPAPVPSRRRRRLSSLRPLPAIALASVALAIGIGGGALLWGGDGGVTRRTVVAHVDAAGAAAHLRMTSDGAKLVVSGMPAPPEGRVYQVWVRHGAGTTPKPTDALFSVSSAGDASVDVPGDLDGVDAVMVTDEPPGGSRLPTRAPVITASLR